MLDSNLADLDGLTGQSARRFDEILSRFGLFAQRGHGIEYLDELSPVDLKQFIQAKGSTGTPSASTMHMRRTSLRILFRVARTELGFEGGDPTLDIVLPPKSGMAARSLTNDEVALGRSYSLHSVTATRQPAAWALCEATAITAELPYITVADLDLGHEHGPRVWLHGSNKREARWGLLDDWGAAQLQRRVDALRTTDHLIYSGMQPDNGGQQSCCEAITDTLIRAGLKNEPDVRPSSLVAWAGSVVYEETDRIEEVARRPGVRSLDSAARFIGFDWK